MFSWTWKNPERSRKSGIVRVLLQEWATEHLASPPQSGCTQHCLNPRRPSTSYHIVGSCCLMLHQFTCGQEAHRVKSLQNSSNPLAPSSAIVLILKLFLKSWCGTTAVSHKTPHTMHCWKGKLKIFNKN